jgi:hypothetical protein
MRGAGKTGREEISNNKRTSNFLPVVYRLPGEVVSDEIPQHVITGSYTMIVHLTFTSSIPPNKWIFFAHKRLLSQKTTL